MTVILKKYSLVTFEGVQRAYSFRKLVNKGKDTSVLTFTYNPYLKVAK